MNNADIPELLLIYNSEETNTQKCKISFTSTMSLFEGIASRIAGNDERVIKSTEQFLNSVKQIPPHGGARVTVPASNVGMSFKPSKKKKTMISMGEKCHNKASEENICELFKKEGITLLKEKPKEAAMKFK